MAASRWHSAMDNPINWSLKVGRVFDIDIRLHLLFLIWGVLQILEDMSAASRAGAGWAGVIGWGTGVTLTLFLCVLLHEFGHCFAARRVGGEADQILLWPLGGLASVSPPHRPRAHFITTIWGPLVNVAIFGTAGLVLAIRAGSFSALPLNPFHPFVPLAPIGPYDTLTRVLLLVFGINYLLTLFNLLLPFYPMDGGRLLHAWLWKRHGYRTATLTATFVGMVGAVGFGVVALMTGNLMLVGLAFFGYLTCYQQRQMAKEYAAEDDLGYDFSRGFRAFEPDRDTAVRPGFFKRRRAARLAKALVREREEAEARDREFDRILAKISREGMGALSGRERKFLESETQRRKV
ncbi:MAG: hypothetical protein BroJett003_21930 [Planctomycetota bacterium]|nr:MAG: hypothetical protein BroJett003_21930 [Planctomycetota bacterium]